MIRAWWVVRVIRAARVWALCRAGRVDGETYHRACVALSDAVDAMEGRLKHPPRLIPTPQDISAGKERVRRAQGRSRNQRPNA